MVLLCERRVYVTKFKYIFREISKLDRNGKSRLLVLFLKHNVLEQLASENILLGSSYMENGFGMCFCNNLIIEGFIGTRKKL